MFVGPTNWCKHLMIAANFEMNGGSRRPTLKMIVILLGWLALVNFLPFLPSWDLQIYPLLIKHAQEKLCCTGRNGIF